MVEDPTPKVRLELSLHEDRQPRALGIPGCVGEKRLEVSLHGPVHSTEASGSRRW
jgi:hypothetical protein